MRNISISFGGIHAVDNASVDLYPGEVVALLGHNGAGKSTLIKILSGAYKRDSGEILINGEAADISNPRDAKEYGIETIYQTLALADNVDAAANLYPRPRAARPAGARSTTSRWKPSARKVMGRLNPNFQRFKEPVKALSGGQRQSVAIARAILFNARILIMDEPTAALGPQETAQVGELIKQLKTEGIGIFLISHDIHDVFDLADRVSRHEERPGRRPRAHRGRHQGRGARHDHSRQGAPEGHPRPRRHEGRLTAQTPRPRDPSRGLRVETSATNNPRPSRIFRIEAQGILG